MKKWNSILLYFLISSIIVIFQLIFFKRFIIQLDIAVIILAAAGITYTILPALDKTRVWRAAGICMILLLLVTSAIPTIKYVREARPLINEAQLQAIDWIKNNTEDNAYVLATDIDAPWVLAWSGRKVIAPGLFEWDVHNKNEWFGFFEATQPETAEDFLSVYDDTIYIYFAKNEGNYIGLDKFEGGSFINVYDDDSAVVYKYPGGN